MAFYFYVLRSLKDGSPYKGNAENIEPRLAQHNSGKTKSLKHCIPFKLLYLEEFSTREEALQREKWSKTLQGGRELRKLLEEKI